MGVYIPVSYEKKCSYCGKEYTAHNTRSKYCSKKCKDISIRIKNNIPCNTNTEPYHKTCVICGTHFDSFREKAKTCSHECAVKRHRDTQRKKGMTWHEYLAKRQTEAAERSEQKRIEKATYLEEHTVEKSCVICGATFVCLDSESRKTCSHECSKELTRKKRRRHDKRVLRDRRIDNIDLKRLYDRDQGTCYICGCKCDWHDWRVSDNGHTYPGDKYPTIDHIVPVSLGGCDAWNNVRLACWKCNNEKGATVGESQLMFDDFAKPIQKSGAKKTAQYSLDGELIKIWDSTASIRRELGFNDTHIQDVCRRYRSNTGNAYGYHWEYVT